MARRKTAPGQIAKRSVLIGCYLSQELNAHVEMRLAELSLSKTEYLRNLIEQDLGTQGDPISAGWRTGCRQGYAKFMKEVSLLLKRMSDEVEMSEE